MLSGSQAKPGRYWAFFNGGVVMSGNAAFVWFLYKTAPGRFFLRFIRLLHLDWLAVRFLKSSCSRPLIRWYIARHGVALDAEEIKRFRSFRDFFARERKGVAIDENSSHLISPCDGWLRAYPIRADSAFLIKGSLYRVKDFIHDEALAQKYEGGTCFVFRLCASDYHHYCYIDDGYQGANHYIPGELHSVQPIACETYPVFTLNRRSWCLMTTENFGLVVQTEIGALIVGGIYNPIENARICRGMEKGRFELAGSTIVLLFEKNRVRLLPNLRADLKEIRVSQGMWIGIGDMDGEGNKR